MVRGVLRCLLVMLALRFFLVFVLVRIWMWGIEGERKDCEDVRY